MRREQEEEKEVKRTVHHTHITQITQINILSSLMLRWTLICFASQWDVLLFFFSVLLSYSNNESISLWFWWSLPVSEACVVGVNRHTARTKYPNYSEAYPSKCHLTYTQLLFYLTALHWYSAQLCIETQLNKRLVQSMYTGLCTNTHNLSKHTYSLENNCCMSKGGGADRCIHTAMHSGKKQ